MSRHPLNQAIIAQVLFDLRNGQLRHSLDMGFSEEIIRLLKDDPELISVLLNTSVNWAAIKVNLDILHRLLKHVQENDKEIFIIDQMLKLGASSKMISDVFGLDQREVAFRKRVLDIDKKQGRWQEMSDEQSHQLWHDWQDKIKYFQLDQTNLMDMAKVCMILAKNTNIPMAMIWQSIERWLDLKIDHSDDDNKES